MKTRICLTILAVVLMASTAVWAADYTVGPSNNVNTITYHGDTNTYTCPLGDVWGTPGLAQFLTVPQFNTALGTLTGVSLTLTTTLAGDRALSGATSGYYHSSWGSTSTLQAPVGDLINGGATYSVGFTVGTASPLHILSGSAQASGGSPGGPPVPVTSGNGWAAWQGPGTISLGISSVDSGTNWTYSPDDVAPYLTVASGPGSGPFLVNGYGATGNYLLNTQSDDVMTVTYTYDATDIPEPGSLALLALGLPGLAMWARRRRRGSK